MFNILIRLSLKKIKLNLINILNIQTYKSIEKNKNSIQNTPF